MRRSFKAISLGIVTAMLGTLVYFFVAGYELEEKLGLDALFKIRGTIPVPETSAVVTINKVASDYFGLENDSAKWPRHYHAKLIETLKSRGAKAVVFDIFLKKNVMNSEIKNLPPPLKMPVMLFYLVT